MNIYDYLFVTTLSLLISHSSSCNVLCGSRRPRARSLSSWLFICSSYLTNKQIWKSWQFFLKILILTSFKKRSFFTFRLGTRFINFSLLESSYRFQTLQEDYCNNGAQLWKYSNFIITLSGDSCIKSSMLLFSNFDSFTWFNFLINNLICKIVIDCRFCEWFTLIFNFNFLH